MAGENATLVQQANPLATPDAHAAQQQEPTDEGFYDLDAGEGSVLDDEPDDGADLDTSTDDDSQSSPKEPKDPDPDEEEGDDEEVDEDGEPESEEETLAALNGAPKKTSGIHRLKAELASTRAELENLRKAVPQVSAKDALAAAVAREIGDEPKESDFDDYLKFQTASIAYQVKHDIVSRELKRNAEAAQQANDSARQQLESDFTARVVEARKAIKDFDVVTKAATASPQHPEVITTIMESDHGAKIAYYYAKHPEKVHELNALPLRRQLAEVGKLEARLTVAPKKVTQAPPPIPPVRGGAPRRATQVAPEHMSDREYAKWSAATFGSAGKR